jgi:hypothetical protein
MAAFICLTPARENQPIFSMRRSQALRLALQFQLHQPYRANWFGAALSANCPQET